MGKIILLFAFLSSVGISLAASPAKNAPSAAAIPIVSPREIARYIPETGKLVLSKGVKPEEVMDALVRELQLASRKILELEKTIQELQASKEKKS